eukprot:3928085-Prymnesium_polylepis.1
MDRLPETRGHRSSHTLHEHDALHTRTHPAARGHVPACPDGAPCLPACLLVQFRTRHSRFTPSACIACDRRYSTLEQLRA